jgi:hypothetical protein
MVRHGLRELAGGRRRQSYAVGGHAGTRLCWEPDIPNGNTDKLNGMNWRTSWRLYGLHNLNVNSALVRTAAKLGLLEEQLDRIDLRRRLTTPKCHT